MKDIREQFNLFGNIIDIYIPKNHNVPMGFAFVMFKNEKDVDYLRDLNPKIMVVGRKVFMARACKRGSFRSS